VALRFGSATHRAVVWVNGTEVARHDGGYMPFSGFLGDTVKFGAHNRVVVVVNNELSYTSIPCGLKVTKEDGKDLQFPFFDFFNYSGLHRPVKLIAVPKERITDVTVQTSISGSTGVVGFTIETNGNSEVTVDLLDQDGEVAASATGKTGELSVPKANLWRPGEGYLYTLSAAVGDRATPIDQYTLDIGIRTVEVSGSRFLINGEPFYFKGFGKHEDCEYRGRGYDPVVMLRDFELMDWIGANSIRTSHYPYSEEFMQMADRRGLVVIDETPAVGMFDLMMNFVMAGTGAGETSFFDRDDVKTDTLANHKRAIDELIKRDKNHACVVMWCLANEPDTSQEGSRPYFEQVFEYSRTLDPQNRPLTFTNFMRAPFGRCKAHDFADVILLNRYYGWYLQGGPELPYAIGTFKKELKGWESTGKPIVMAEYGADTMAGVHKLPSVMWSEEYQIEYLQGQHEAFDSCKNLAGEQVWNFADFQTTEGIMRVNGNKKGVFTRDRQPKAAAYLLKERWAAIPDFGYKG
jgi:beta-glucuronidase